MLSKISEKNLSAMAFIILLFLGLVLGCGGSGAICVGRLTVDGTTYEGKDVKEVQARDNACSSYCIEGDKGYDRMYHEFIKTPEAKKINIDFNQEKISLKEKKWAATANEKLSGYVDECRKNCLNLHNEGKQIIEVKCQ
jgi:hypothetical protein